MMSSKKLTQLSVICWVAVLFCQSVQSQLQVGFYSNSCRRAELIVRSAVRDGINKDRGVAAGLVRMHFHDCFVQVYLISLLLVLSLIFFNSNIVFQYTSDNPKWYPAN